MRSHTVAMAAEASPKATLACAVAFATTDFRQDLKDLTIPTLVVHGDSDAVLPAAVSGLRTAEAVVGSRLLLVRDAPHGLIVTHAAEFNSELLAFLEE
jgi:pimeloyl-ACP methyl ester carboxylesterase